MKLILFIQLCFITSFVFAQDSLQTIHKEGYKKWTNYKTAPRFSLGLQKAFYAELGIARHQYMYNDLGYAAKAYYAALEYVPIFKSSTDKSIYGLKLGYELNARILALGLEGKYLTDFKQNDFVLTSKLGLGIMGVIHVFYGYNISTNRSPFPKIGHHQFSLVCNLNKKALKNQSR